MNLHIDIVLMLLILLFLLIKYIIFIIQEQMQKIESKELKYDFGLDNFALDKFYATEAAHRFMLVAYNIMALLNIKLVQTNMQLSTLRSYCFALGSWMTNHANEKVLNISLQGKEDLGWMDYLKI